MSAPCIPCKSNDTSIAKSINTKKLSALYKNRAGTDAEHFFKQPVIHLHSCANCGLKFYLPQAVGDGKCYDELQRYSGYYLEEKAAFKEAARFISATDDVLEVGCGKGLFTNFKFQKIK